MDEIKDLLICDNVTTTRSELLAFANLIDERWEKQISAMTHNNFRLGGNPTSSTGITKTGDTRNFNQMNPDEYLLSQGAFPIDDIFSSVFRS